MQGPLIWVITNISLQFDKDFRDTISRKLNRGIKKGDLREAVIEAVSEWMEKQKLKQMAN